MSWFEASSTAGEDIDDRRLTHTHMLRSGTKTLVMATHRHNRPVLDRRYSNIIGGEGDREIGGVARAIQRAAKARRGLRDPPLCAATAAARGAP